MDGREAVEAKSPVEHLRISALGNAIDVAVAVATSVAESGLAQLRREVSCPFSCRRVPGRKFL